MMAEGKVNRGVTPLPIVNIYSLQAPVILKQQNSSLRKSPRKSETVACYIPPPLNPPRAT